MGGRELNTVVDYSALGQRVREARHKKGLTQQKLAEQTGVTTAFIGHIERGQRRASLETLFAIGMILRVSPNELLEDSLRSMPSTKEAENLAASRSADSPLGVGKGRRKKLKALTS